MSQVDELLNSLTDEQMALYSVNGSEEPVITIGLDRNITVPDSLKRIAVEHDHNIETVTFRCPRKWDNHDLYEMPIYINCKLPKGEVVSFIAENVRVVDESTILFDWTITRTVTQQKGNLIFLVCAKKTETVEGESVENVHWNTELCTAMHVSEGLESEVVVEEEYPDIVTQLLERMTAVEKVAIKKSDMDALVEQATQASQQAFDSAENVENSAAEIRNSYANAIKGNVSGEIVRVDDVSPLEHDVEVKVHGKNLVKNDYVNGESSTDRSVIQKDGDTIIFPATDGNLYGIYINNSDLGMKVGKTYTASIGNVTAFDSDSYGWRIRYADGSTAVLSRALSTTFTPEKEVEKIIFRIGSPYQGNTESIITGIQIEEGSVATEYESYINPDEVEVIRYGKNLVDSTQYITPRTVNGITVQYLPNEDAFLFNGTATSAARIGYSQLIGACEGEQFTCTIIPISGSVDKGTAYHPPVIFFGKSDTRTGAGTNNISFQFTDTKTTFTQRVSGKYLKDSWFWISVGNILTNYKVRIQFERGDIATEYEQYQGRSTDTDGIKSVSPTMTIFTDTPGAIVDVTYNRDTTKMFESYVLTDKAKSEIAVLVKNHISSEIDAIEASLDEIIAIQEKLI